MVRTQLYLPEDKYQFAKKQAKKQNTSFAGYIRILIEKDNFVAKKEKSLKDKYPFIGMFKGDGQGITNEEIDDIVYGL